MVNPINKQSKEPEPCDTMDEETILRKTRELDIYYIKKYKVVPSSMKEEFEQEIELSEEDMEDVL